MLFLGSVHLLKLFWAPCQGLLTRPLLPFFDLIQSFLPYALTSLIFLFTISPGNWEIEATCFPWLPLRTGKDQLNGCKTQLLAFSSRPWDIYPFLVDKNPLKVETILGIRGALG